MGSLWSSNFVAPTYHGNRHEQQHLYHLYALSKELFKGSSSRPPLPLELVLYILRLSECNLVSSLSVLHQIPVTVWSIGEVERSKWFATDPLTSFKLSRLSSLKLVTLSRNQGWCGDPAAGCWSWFDIAIYRPTRPDIPNALGQAGGLDPGSYEPKLDSNGKALRWTSHYNYQYVRENIEYEGMDFDSSHEIWRNIEDGDRIVVEACARYPNWSCEGVEGKLLILEDFVPSSEFIRLMG